MIYFTTTLERLLRQYIRTERARYDPRGRKRLEELDDRDPLFLTRTGKPYSPSAFYHHWNRLFEHAQSQLKKEKQKEVVEFTPHDLRHLRVTRTVTKIRENAHGDRSVEAQQLEGFHQIMAWRSRETMQIYINTMNEGQAIKAVLKDEEEQEQAAAHPQPGYVKHRETPAAGMKSADVSPTLEDDEFDWYEN